MISIKSAREVDLMREAGAIVAEAIEEVERLVAPGVATIEIDSAVEKLIRRRGGVPAFKGYRGFKGSICASVNEEVVHGIPGPRSLREGDVFKLDVGVQYHGYFADSARTFGVGAVSSTALKLMDTCREALERGIAQVRPGARLRVVSTAIEQYVRSRGYAVVEKYVGHGIGRELHEPPQVPNFFRQDMFDYDVTLRSGMTIAIEPMVNEGTPDVEQLNDGWTVVTKDRKLSTHFEHTVLVTADGAEILTVRRQKGAPAAS